MGRKSLLPLLGLLVLGGLPAQGGESPAPPQAQKWIALRRALHKNPELANRETQTMRRVASYLSELGLPDVRTEIAKTGVVATIKGGRPGPTVALRAPMDAFPIQEKRDAPTRSRKAGVSHACGHDAMMAITLGAAELLWARRKDLAGDVRLLFQPAEEGPPEGEEGGAPLMIKEGALEGVSAIVTLHVDSDIPAGSAGLHPGAVYAGSDTLQVRVEGASAHAATPWKGVDAIAVAGQILSGLQMVASRQTGIWSPVVLTVGTIQAGTRSNALAGEARLTGTLRSYSAESRSRARESISRIVRHVAQAFGARAEISFSEEIPPTVNDARLLKHLRPTLEQALGPEKLRILEPLPFADDFSLMAERVPSFYFQLGVKNEKEGITAGTHTESFDVDESAIPLGARLLAELAAKALAFNP